MCSALLVHPKVASAAEAQCMTSGGDQAKGCATQKHPIQVQEDLKW